MIRSDDLLHPTSAGLYCPPGDFYIDPVRNVERAVITHGHADHARAGHTSVLATPETLAIMAARYGENFTHMQQAISPGEKITHNGVSISVAPAGHVLGSVQVIVEHKGLTIVCTGDYKRREDPTCPEFEVVPCHVFISEATFGLPVFNHPNTRAEIEKLIASVRRNPDRTHLVGAYSLGKAQRVISLLRLLGYDAPVYLHGAMVPLCQLYEAHGIYLGQLKNATIREDGRSGAKQEFAGKIVVCPPSAMQDKWARRFPDPITCFASGWMGIRQRTKQRGVELPLVLSDHADWTELTRTIREVAPEELWVTHGREDALVRWAELEGMAARPLSLVGYEDEHE